MSQMNAGIILAGQTPDFLGTIDRANTAAARQNQIQQQNALAELYKTQGAGIAAGDQGALNALAVMDPMAALDVQKQRLGMDATRQGMDINRQELEMRKQDAARKAQTWAMGLDAAQAQQSQARIRQGLMQAGQAHAAGDLAGVNSILTAVGEQPLQSLDQFPYVAAQYEGVLAALESAGKFGQPEPVRPMSTPGKVMADMQAGILTEEQAAQAMAGKNEIIESDGQGGFRIVRGAVGDAPPKLTVDAAKNTGFLLRTQEANKILNDLEAQGTRFAQQAYGAAPLGAGNYLRDPEFQQFDQARRDFVNAILRRESGAVISDQEFENANQQYFPVPGDSEQVIAQKRRNRETAIEGLRVGSGEGAAYLERQQPKNVERYDPQTPDFTQMSTEELEAYIERGGQ